MSIFNGLTMLSGLTFFLYGMNCMEDGLGKLSGGRLERLLEKLTTNKLRAVTLGAVVTALIQSSSATTVMVVGFVNSGILKLSQAVGVIMGANIGTTLTSWVLSLSGIEGDSFWLRLLKPIYFSSFLAAPGIFLLMFSKNDKKRSLAIIFIGFAILMSGMDTMSKAVAPLADMPEFTRIFTMFSNPILGLAAGAALTAIIQSSSASIGILQALCLAGPVSVGSVVPIILGQNIGTCATAMLSGIGASRNARRAALIHLYFNLVGTVLFLALFYAGDVLFDYHFMENTASAATIAMLHSVFNIVSTMILLPFSRLLEKMAMLTIRDEAGEDGIPEESKSDQTQESRKMPQEKLKLLEERFLEMPAFALKHCREAANRMADLAGKGVFHALQLLKGYTDARAAQVEAIEHLADLYEDELGTYLVRLSKHPFSAKDSNELNILLHCIGDFERIADHAMNIREAAQEIQEKGLAFSGEAKVELAVYEQALEDVLKIALQAFCKGDVEAAKQVEPIEEVIDYLSTELKNRHIKRLRAGLCTIELGFILSDLITNAERIADHCSNIAVCLIQMEGNGMEMHGYLEMLRQEGRGGFMELVEENRRRYALPEFRVPYNLNP